MSNVQGRGFLWSLEFGHCSLRQMTLIAYQPRRVRPRSRTTVIRKKPSLDFSVTGLVYCTMMMFLGLAAVNSQANLLFGVFGLMIGILLVSGLISKLVLRKLSMTRALPEHGVV